MKFGRLDEVFQGEQSIYEALTPDKEIKAPSKVSEILHKLSHYGMAYSKDVYMNMHAIPANTDLIPGELNNIVNIYGNAFKDGYHVKGEEDKPYAEKTMDQKRQVLRKMAQQPEIEDILDIMSNECIVYDSFVNRILILLLYKCLMKKTLKNYVILWMLTSLSFICY